MTAIRRILPSGALLTAEIIDADATKTWLAAILDRYPDSPEPTRISVRLMGAPVPQGHESYLLTRWIDVEDQMRVVTRRVASYAEPGPHLMAHDAEVAGLQEKHPPKV